MSYSDARIQAARDAAKSTLDDLLARYDPGRPTVILLLGGMQLLLLNATTVNEIEAVFATLSKPRVDAMIVAADPFFSSRRQQLVTLAARHAVPTMHVDRGFADAGGLISYGVKNAGLFHNAGVYVGKILRGEKPPICPFSSRQISSWLSTSRPPRRLG